MSSGLLPMLATLINSQSFQLDTDKRASRLMILGWVDCWFQVGATERLKELPDVIEFRRVIATALKAVGTDAEDIDFKPFIDCLKNMLETLPRSIRGL